MHIVEKLNQDSSSITKDVLMLGIVNSLGLGERVGSD